MNENKKLKINLSFPQHEKDMYDFVQLQRHPSAFIRQLIRLYIYENNIEINNIENQIVKKNENIILNEQPVNKKELWKIKIRTKKQIMQRRIKSKSD